jgi:hypothetical protein
MVRDDMEPCDCVSAFFDVLSRLCTMQATVGMSGLLFDSSSWILWTIKAGFLIVRLCRLVGWAASGSGVLVLLMLTGRVKKVYTWRWWSARICRWVCTDLVSTFSDFAMDG